jgi:tRNA-dihydrouridine synthase B
MLKKHCEAGRVGGPRCTLNLLEELKKNPFVLAPMAGITDRAFRSLMRELGCGPVVTELVSATGLKYSSQKTRSLMAFDQVQHPIGIQIFGEAIEDMAFAAKEIEDMGADFVDINFGCPVQKVVKKGAGAAALKDPVHFRNVLRGVKSATKLPVTIKVRTGWDENSRNSHEIAQIAFDEGMEWMAIHGRTRAQGYAGQADWDYIREVKANAKIPILGNGDISNAQMANDRLRESGCDGVLIGRGCLKNPWIFQQALKIYHSQEMATAPTLKNFDYLFERLHFHLIQNGESRVTALQIKKLSAWYSAGYPDSANFRKSVFQIQDTSSVLAATKSYFDSIASYLQKDTSHEPFLMGGHG